MEIFIIQAVHTILDMEVELLESLVRLLLEHQALQQVAHKRLVVIIQVHGPTLMQLALVLVLLPQMVLLPYAAVAVAGMAVEMGILPVVVVAMSILLLLQAITPVAVC